LISIFQYATTTAHLIDEAVDCAWHDMTPLVFRLANMEYDRLGGADSEALTESLVGLIEKLKAFAIAQKVDMELPDIKAKKAPSSAIKNKGTGTRTPPKKTTSSTTPVKKPPTDLKDPPKKTPSKAAPAKKAATPAAAAKKTTPAAKSTTKAPAKQ